MGYKIVLIIACLISLMSFVPAPHLTSVYWNMTETIDGQPVRLNVEGMGLIGYEISFQILERDEGGTDDIVVSNPPNIFYTGSPSYTTWISIYQIDTDDGQSDPPEYYFNATVVGESNFMNSTTVDANMLKVSLPITCGDGTCNGVEDCSTCPQDCETCIEVAQLPFFGNYQFVITSGIILLSVYVLYKQKRKRLYMQKSKKNT
jgi:hypothetical protein